MSKRLFLFVSLVVFVAFGAALGKLVLAAVELKYVTAEQINGKQAVEFSWETATEESAAFYILRGNTIDDVTLFPADLTPDYLIANAISVVFEGQTLQQIPSKGTTSTGYTYVTVDDNVEFGNTYFYLLVEIGVDGTIVPQTDFIRAITLVDPDAEYKLLLPIVLK